MLNELFQRAQSEFASVFFCGGEFAPALSQLLQAETGQGYVLQLNVPEGEEAQLYLRAALRQDPDCIVLDQRAAECSEMVLQSMATGHRMLTGHPLPPAQVLGHLLAVELAEMVLPHSLFLEVGDGGEILAVHQYLPGGLVALAQRQGEGWQTLAEPEWRAPYVPPPEDFSALEPAEYWIRPQPSLLESLRRLRAPQARQTWVPRLRECPPQAPGNHYGGVPLLVEGESWPCCGSCQAQMMLVVQSELPQLEGVFQFFYCINENCTVAEAWAAFANNSLARLLQPAGLKAPADGPELRYPSYAIEGWTEGLDFPDWEETQPELQPWLDYLPDWREIIEEGRRCEGLVERYRLIWDFLGLQRAELAEVVKLLSNQPGDKAGGWPRWTQSAQYPACRQCGQAMVMVLQVNNDGGEGSCYGQLFAADGNGHVFQCRNHPQEMTFSWACG